MNAKVLVMNHLEIPKECGVFFRLLCMTGKNKGQAYFLNDERILMGRSDKTDIQIWDAKSSREHAELIKINDTYIVTDLDSQNGIIINDLKVAQHTLSDGDKIIIGKTVYKFSIISNLLPINIDEDEEEKDITQEKKKKSVQINKSNKKKKLIYLGIFIMVAILMFNDETPKKIKSNNNRAERISEVGSDFTASLKNKKFEEDQELKQKVDAILHRGRREYRERNFFRAIEEFSHALVLSPNNGRASYYLSKTKQALDDEIENNFLKAGRDVDSLKYRGAIISYCSIIKLLESYPEDQRYKDALANIRNVEKRLGMVEGEVKCLEGQ